MNYYFKKEERLKSKKAFEELVKSKSVFFSHPLRIIWITKEQGQTYPAQVAFAVPKKNFKLATKRNLIKRRMREAYRLNKHVLYQFLQKNNICLHILIVYIGTDITSYHEVEKKIRIFFNHIMEKFQLPAG